MNLQEAIMHCKEKIDCTECGQEHKQLAEWLEELVQYRKMKLIDADILIKKLEGHAEGCQYDSNRTNDKAKKDMYLNIHTGFMKAVCIVMNMLPPE